MNKEHMTNTHNQYRSCIKAVIKADASYIFIGKNIIYTIYIQIMIFIFAVVIIIFQPLCLPAFIKCILVGVTFSEFELNPLLNLHSMG